jgi:hypothetical protein
MMPEEDGLAVPRRLNRPNRPASIKLSALGSDTDLWTLKRVRILIEKQFGIAYSDVHVWRILGSLGFSSQKPAKRTIECNEDAFMQWKKRTWPALKKKACREGRVILFIDESGLSERPTRVRTWAPKGQTPIIQFHFNWKRSKLISAQRRTALVAAFWKQAQLF